MLQASGAAPAALGAASVGALLPSALQWVAAHDGAIP